MSCAVFSRDESIGLVDPHATDSLGFEAEIVANPGIPGDAASPRSIRRNAVRNPHRFRPVVHHVAYVVHVDEFT